MNSDKIFQLMIPYLKENGSQIVKKIGYIYQFQISKTKGQEPSIWTVNLKVGNGKVEKGSVQNPDATFVLLDDDAVSLFDGTLNPQTAFMQGKMKIKGSMPAALKFTPEIFPKKPKL